ncbi:MAG: DUF4270 family protein, partial [Bacteroidia bacterium]
LTIYKDTTIPEKYVYVQPQKGVRTKITLPYLKHFFDDGKKAINKAELILNVEPSTVSGSYHSLIFPPSTQLTLNIADSIPALQVVPDYYEGAAFFGGMYDSINHQYIFNIARYVQQILDGSRRDEGLYIMPTYINEITTANRVQLIGGDKSLIGHMRLNITYTPLVSARHSSPAKQVQKNSSPPAQLINQTSAPVRLNQK